jgi:hypothetical protein
MPPSPSPAPSALQHQPRPIYSRAPPVQSNHLQHTAPEYTDWVPHQWPSRQPPTFQAQLQKPPLDPIPGSHVPHTSAYRSDAASTHSFGDNGREDTKSPIAPPKRFRDDAFAAYAQELESCLSPLAFQGNGLSSMPTSPHLMARQRVSGGQMMPFMGHAATAPSSPSGMQLFMEMDDGLWGDGDPTGRGRLPDFSGAKMPGDDSSIRSREYEGSESVTQHPFADFLPPPAFLLMQNGAPS